jgi:hypothetical protein
VHLSFKAHGPSQEGGQDEPEDDFQVSDHFSPL